MGRCSFPIFFGPSCPTLENPALANLSIRQALAAGVDREDLSGYLAQNQQIASVPVPPAVTLGGASYREQAGDSDGLDELPYTAAELFQIGLRELAADASPSLTLICPDSDGIPLLLSQLQRQWRDTLGVFINIEPLEPSELDSRIASRDYDLALCPDSRRLMTVPEAVLSSFTGGESLTGGRTIRWPAT